MDWKKIAIAEGMVIIAISLYLVISTTKATDHSDATASRIEVTEVDENQSSPAEQISPQVQPIVPSINSGPRSKGLATLKERYELGLDPMIYRLDRGYTDEDIAEYNRLHVIPFQKPNWQSTCQRIPDPDDPRAYFNDCESIDLNPPHAYQDIEIAQLTELAHSDPVAAIFMGQRTEDNKSKIEWYLRAGALSGKSGPIKTLAERHFYAGIDSKMVSRNGELVDSPLLVEATVIRLALEQIAERMLDPRAQPELYRKALSSKAGESAPQLIQLSNEITGAFLSEMAKIQIEITGSSQIQEIIDR